MDKDTTKIALMEYLIPLNHNFLTNLIQKHDLDRYVKKLDSIATAKLFIFAQLMQIQHYTDISLQLKNKKKLQKTVGLASISTSQLSRKWRNLDHTFLEQVFRQVVQQVVSRFGTAKANQKLGMIHLVDSSTITLCLSQHRWATFSKHKGAVKLHLRFVEMSDMGYPDQALLTTGSVADRGLMDDLVFQEADALNVFDRGYVDYEKFDDYCEQSVTFITRLKRNASFKVIEKREVQPNTTDTLRDDVIWLGYRGTRYRMKNHLRLVEFPSQDDEPLLICTNDFEASAAEIRELYRRRWKIEMFFKWIKGHLHIKRFYGHSPNAVYNQIYAALIAFCLGLLMQASVHHNGTLWQLMRQLRISWDASFRRFLQALSPPPGRTSKGRRRQIDVEKEYLDVYKQVSANGSRYLDELDDGILI